MQLPYVRFPPTRKADASPLQELANKVAKLCGAQYLALPIGNVAAVPPSDTFDPSSTSRPEPERVVLSLSMPPVTESAGARKRSVAEHGAQCHAWREFVSEKN